MTELEYEELLKSLGQIRIALDSLTQRIVNLERRWTEHALNHGVTDNVTMTPPPEWEE